jgi:ATP/maltotriose-dependent transcriptional regulator MalT
MSRAAGSVRTPRIVRRVALVERLHQDAARIVSIMAPAGYGKTTLAMQLIADTNAANCDCLEVAGPGDFARRLFAELAPYHPERATAWAYEQIATVGNDEDATQLALSAWSLVGDPAVVIFENAESLVGIPRLAHIWRMLLAANSRPIIICSRRAVALPFGHGIGPQDVAVVGMSDLALSAVETRSLLEPYRMMNSIASWPSRRAGHWPSV